MEIIFEKPDYLWLLLSIPIIIAVHFATLKTTTRKAVRFANFEAIARITGGQTLSKNFFLLIIRLIIVLLFIFALSGITLSYIGQGSNFDFALAIDSSNSMLIEDLQPNRLEVAKERAIQFIDKLSGNNGVSVVSFASTAFVQTFLTKDHVESKIAVRGINALETGGTAIGDAIISGVNSLIPSKNPKVVVLLTDGRGNTGVEIEDAIEYAKLKQITIHTIGLGTEQGAEYTKGVNLTLDENTLREIAARTNGKYFRATTSGSLSQAYKEIANLTETTVFRNLTLLFTLIALFLLLVEWILFNTKYRTIP